MVKLGVYKHYKGNLYQVVGVARQSENLEEMVVYKALYDAPGFDHHQLWVRPLDMFLEDIEIEGIVRPRFVYQQEEHAKI